MIHRSRIARIAVFATTTALGSGLAAPASAQSSPPVYSYVDENGIDLATGDFNFILVEGSIGSGDSELQMIRYFGRGAILPTFSDNWGGTHLVVMPGPTLTSGNVASVVVDNRTETFTRSGTTWASDQGNGSTLQEMPSGDLYQYRSDKGVVIRFGSPTSSGNFCVSAGQTYCTALPSTRTERSGRSVTFGWQVITDCTGGCSTDYRLASVTNNAGYSLTANYASNGPALDDNWRRRTSVVFQNTLAPISNPPTITYSYPSTGVTQVTDPAGRTWRFTQGNYWQMVGIRRPGAPTSADTTTLTAVDGQNVDLTRNGVTTRYTTATDYTSSGGVVTAIKTITKTHPIAGQTVVVTDTSVGRPTSITDPLNRVTTFTYDSQKRLTQTTYPEGNKAKLTYDARGNVTETRRISKTPGTPPDIVSTAIFPGTCTNVATCDEPTATIDPQFNQTDYTYDTSTGLVTSVTAPAPTTGAARPQSRLTYSTSGGVTLLTGTSSCQTLTSCTGLADENKSTILYNANLLPNSITSSSGDGVLTATTTVQYDAVGNAISADGPLAGSGDTTVVKYDAARQVVGVIGPDPDGGGPLVNYAARMTYNADGQVTSMQEGTTAGQSDSSWAAFTTSRQVASNYDSNARKISDVTSAGSTIYGVIQYSYDARGRLDCTATRMNETVWNSLPSSACDLQAMGSSGPDRISKTTYDAADQITKAQSAFNVPGTQADEVSTTYNANGTTASMTDAENNKTTYAYDGLDRLVTTTFPSVTKGVGTTNSNDFEQLTYVGSELRTRRLRDGTNITYFYDALYRVRQKFAGSEPVVSYTYNLFDQLRTAATSTQTITLTYDALGRLTSDAQPYGTMAYEYDAAGRRTKMTWPDTFFVTYAYDTAGNLKAVKESGTTDLATFDYDSLGRRNGQTQGNGVTAAYGYDAVSRLASLAWTATGTTGNLTLGLDYNNAGQIKRTTRSNDAYSWTGAKNINRIYAANGLNQFTGVGTYNVLTYDGRGNLINDTSTDPYNTYSDTYTYSAENLLLTGPGGTVLNYDPLLRLSQVSSNTTVPGRFVYDNGNVVAVANSSGVFNRRYVLVPGSDELITEYKTMSGTKNWKMVDERASVIAATDSTGTPGPANTFDEYGIPGTNNAGRYQYTGQTWVPELGLYYYKARFYSPTLGRFLQTDPIGYSGGMNLYNYVGSDPTNFTDPSGQVCFPNGDGLNGAKGGGGCSDNDIVVTGFVSTGIPSTSISLGISVPPSITINLPRVDDIVVTATRHQAKQPPKYQAPGNQPGGPCAHHDPFGMCDSYGYPSGTPEILRLERCDRLSIGMDPIGAATGTRQLSSGISGGSAVLGAITKGALGNGLAMFGGFLGGIQLGSAIMSSRFKCGG